MATRRRVGDRAGDTIIGEGAARIVTLVERKTGVVRLRRVANGEAEPTMRVILHALYPLRGRVHALSRDNGREFAEHALIDIALEARSQFADPCSSWLRGSNENTHGLRRQCLAKGCDLAAVTNDQLQPIERRFSHGQRKRSGDRKPQAMVEASVKRGALRR